jgi:1-acyl-sn-glycerol-3-phosphate acyltransferase
MKASLFQKIRIMILSIYVTLRITVIVLYKVYRGTYKREYGDIQLLRWWSSKLLEIVKTSCEVSDQYKVKFEPRRPYIIMSNHRSHYDIPIIFKALPGSIRMLTKKELFNIPLWGRGMKAGEFISIDRHNQEQAFKDLAFAKEKLMSGIRLWIAPEGTRSRDAKLGSFKKGGFVLAIQTGATIIPVGISGSEKILPADTFDFSIGQKVQVAIGKPIDASQYTLENKDALMEDVRKSIAQLAGEA